MNPAIVLSCRGGSETALNVVRALGERGVPVVVVSEDADAASAASRYCVEHRVTPPFSQSTEGLAEVLRLLGKQYGTRIPVFPTADPDLQALCMLDDDIDPNVVSTLGDPRLVRRLIDKAEFRQLARERDLPVPQTHAPDVAAEVAELAPRLRYPVIVKPAFPFHWHPALAEAFDGKKAVRIDDREGLETFCAPLGASHLGVLIQDYIAGDDDEHFDVHAFVDRQGRCQATFTGRKWRICPPHAGSGCHVEAVDEPGLEQLATDILARIGFRGIANINFKRDTASGKFYLLEINARVSQWSIFTTRAGINMPWLAYCDALGIDPGPLPSRRYGLRFLDGWNDLRAAVRYHQEGSLSWGTYLRSILRLGMVYQVFSLDDLRPWWRVTVLRAATLARRMRAGRTAGDTPPDSRPSPAPPRNPAGT